MQARKFLPLAGAALLFVLPLLPVPEFWITQLNYIGLFALVSLGLVLLTGVGGLTSFGHAAFVGLGAYTTAVMSTSYAASPWLALLEVAEEAGEEASAELSEVFETEAGEGVRHTKSEVEAAVKRAGRRARTEVLDTGLGLAAGWARDWAVLLAGSPELAFNLDRIDRLSAQVDRLTIPVATEAVQLVEETRQRLRLNVSEELALEALCFRLERLLGGAVVG